MSTLIFRNNKLQGILKITEQATVFKATLDEAIAAYENDTGRTYTNDTDLDRYYERTSPTIWLVKDDGIFLTTSAKLDIYPSDGSHICYADGFEPDAPDCWERSKEVLGGSDLIISFRYTNEIKKALLTGADIYINVTSDILTMQLVYH